MAYVSTDVDRILEYVKSRNKAELIEVARALGMRAMEVDKWAKILEKQGLISIQYDITKMYLVWKSQPEEQESIDKYIHEVGLAHNREKERDPPAPKPLNANDIHSKPILAQPSPKHSSGNSPAVTPKKTLKKDSGFLHGGAFNLFILGRKADVAVQKDSQEPSTSLKQATKEYVKEKPAEKVLKNDSGQTREQAHTKTGQIHETSQALQTSKSTARFLLPFLSRNTSERQKEDSVPLKHRIDAVNEAISEIADIKAEREKLYAQEYLPLIARLDAQVSQLNSKISESEFSLSSIKGRIASLPDAVASIDSELRKSAEEARRIEKEYLDKSSSISKMQADLSKLREEIQADLSKSKSALKYSMDMLASLDAQMSKASSVHQQALARIKEAKQKIEDEQEVIEKMAALVDGSQIQAEELQAQISDIKKKVERANEDIKSLELASQKIQEIEQKLSTLKSAYDMKVGELKRHVSMQESEIKSIRAVLEKAYISKYLEELRKISAEQEKSALEVMRRDQELEDRLNAARERLQKLLKESGE
ncbi:MAG: hypothetical protein QXS93_02640 [Candidatus Micrarchaeia archaeon]